MCKITFYVPMTAMKKDGLNLHPDGVDTRIDRADAVAYLTERGYDLFDTDLDLWRNATTGRFAIMPAA